MIEPQVQYVISIMSRDRVGIVHEISSAISELNGNIADIRQSVLCGYFTMILLVSFPSGVSLRSIEQKLAEVDAHSETAIDVAVKKVDETGPTVSSAIPENAYILTATGVDQIGFVAVVASFCASHKINILDLSTTVSGGLYIMILMVDLNHCNSISSVRQDMQRLSKKTGFNLVLQHYDIFKAVNEINLPLH
jgi:glycine cleavage system transcriptional repressor